METKIELSFTKKELSFLWHTAINNGLCGFLTLDRFTIVSCSNELEGLAKANKSFEFTRGNVKVFDCFLKAKIFSASVSDKKLYAILSNSEPDIEGEEEWFLWYSSKNKGEEENDDTRGKEGIFEKAGIQPKVAGPRTAPEEKKKFVAKRRERKKED